MPDEVIRSSSSSGGGSIARTRMRQAQSFRYYIAA